MRCLRQAGTRVGRVMWSPTACLQQRQSHTHAAPVLPLHTGPYAASRAALDYAWHAQYSPERQRVQDAIIAQSLATGQGCTSQRPWIVFTAGAMGSGKSYAMRNLQHRGLFPLDRFVVVDPDKIKRSLPEMPAYMQQQPKLAATLMHAESGYIAELVEREALNARRNVLVDGSLRNVQWYSRWFGVIRKDFSCYRLAIILVTASPERVFARAAQRAAVTGREVPRHVLEETMRQVPLSFGTLAPLADYTAVLQNDDDVADPRFVQPVTDYAFARVWDGTCDIHPQHALPWQQ